VVHNIPDITGTGSTFALIPMGVRTAASWVIIGAPTANTGDIRVGDSTTSVTSGIPVHAGTTLTIPATGNAESLNLADVWVQVPTGCVCSAVYGKT
jgi:hypothetical protein